MSKKLDALIAEAKADRDPKAVADLDWTAIEARVMKAAAEAPRATVISISPRRKALRYGTAALAVAATLVIYVRRDAAQKQADHPAASVAVSTENKREAASSLTSGDLRIDDAVMPAGHVVRAGDALSIANGRAVLERPQAVSWLIETDDSEAARARVSSAGKPLVLDLEHGAIEAQVVPVATGEAFAVDVISKRNVVRVAVHGTHLRVSRAGDRVVIDLSEGVIAIGIAPSSGLTTGTTVTAPAHVELDPDDLAAMKVEHTHVRPPIQLGDHVVVMATPPTEPAASVAAAPAPAPPKPPKPDAPKPLQPARDIVMNAVRQCAVTHKTSSEVHVTVTSDLQLTVGPDGVPQLLKFNPPLPADIQTCAAEQIYKAKLEETGDVAVPIQFSY